uniref:Uncharacterized protein n=1 Tax=Arundo donax TaxID=35708 RepID=A0A0A8ZQ47_ARUDO
MVLLLSEMHKFGDLLCELLQIVRTHLCGTCVSLKSYLLC